MAQKHKSSQSRKNQHSLYKSQGRYTSNRRRKLERHLAKFPEDEQAKAALAGLKANPNPRRGTPNSRVWGATQRAVAQMFASVGINGLHALQNPKISHRVGDGEHLRYGAPGQVAKSAEA